MTRENEWGVDMYMYGEFKDTILPLSTHAKAVRQQKRLTQQWKNSHNVKFKVVRRQITQ